MSILGRERNVPSTGGVYMRQLFNKLSRSFSINPAAELADDSSQEYIEIGGDFVEESAAQIIVRPFTIEDFSDVKPVLDSIREGYTIALLNIKPLKEKDLIELKRVINKLKKTADAIDGDIAGFGDDYIVVTPGFARIFRPKKTEIVES